ncbi:MAG TPA: hemolysin family protein [Tepidisphaeraceae bacterium]
MDTLWRLLATFGLVAVNAYFVAAEFAAVGARASLLEVEKGPLARLALRVKNQLDLYLSSCQFGVTIASLALGAVTEPLLSALVNPLLLRAHIPPHDLHLISFTIAMAVSTSLHIVIGEQAPKNWAISYSNRLLPILAPPLILFTTVFYPAIWLLNAATHAVLRLTGVRPNLAAHGGLPHTEQELRGLLAQAVAGGTISRGKGHLLTSALNFGNLRVRQIMVPRTRVEYLLIHQPIDQVLKTVQNAGYTRYPLCDRDIDHVIGLVNMKDLFSHLKLVPGKLRFADDKTPDGQAIAIADGKPGSEVHVIGSGEINMLKIKRDVLFVPEMTPVPKLLRQFQARRVHMAIVVDEYGATQGIVTLEDVIEEIVGEIDDEFDPVGRNDFIQEANGYRVSGMLPLRDLQLRLNLKDLGTDEVDTVGGYIVQHLGRWPRAGDTLPLEDRFNIRVLSVLQRRVGQVLITPAEKKAGENGSSRVAAEAVKKV